ncbi:MAG TPA: hypothetical protein VGK02_09635 [Candidatus Aquicultor sp.]|jgi:hypothetical protein
MKRLFLLFIMILAAVTLAAPTWSPAWAGNSQEGFPVSIGTGDLVRFGTSTEVGRDETIRCNVISFGGNTDINGGDIQRAHGAIVEGGTRSGRPGFGPVVPFYGLFSILGLLLTLAFGALVVAALPKATEVLANMVEQLPWQSLGLGVLATILIPFIFAVLAISIIGIPLIPIVAIALPFIYFYGYVGAARWVGRRFIGATHIAQESPVAQVLAGILILGLIGLIPLFGWLVVFIATLFGLGAVLISKFGSGRPWARGTPVAPQAPAGGPPPQSGGPAQPGGPPQGAA